MARPKKQEIEQTQERPAQQASTAIVDTPVPAPSVSPIAQIVNSQKTAYEFEEQRLADKRKVKGVFRDLEVKGGVLKFAFKKWKGDDIVPYELHDGQEYELPLGVVKHLNNLCYHEDSYSKELISADGRPFKNPHPKKVSRFSFQSSDFI